MRYAARFLFGMWLAAVCVFLASCGGGKAPDRPVSEKPEPRTAGTRGGSLTYRVTSPPKTLNYFVADDEPTVIMTLFLLNNRLIAFDQEKQEYVGSLAESWTMAADGRTVDVTMREGLKFSDGQPLTAKDVIFTLDAIYDKRTNASVFRDSLMVDGKQIATNLIDDRKMQFIFPEKIAGVENYLENLAVLPKHKLEADFKAGKLAESWKITADPQSVVTSGPFVVESVSAGERVTLKRNPHYWKTDANGVQMPYLDQLVLEVVADANNSFARLSQNTIDIADRIRTSDFAALRSAGGSVRAFDVGPGLTNDHLFFNQNRAKKSGEALDKAPKYAWFTDKRFRRAVSHAIDRSSIAATTLQGLATPLYGFVPAGNRVWLNSDLPKTEYSLEKARQLLTEAGFVQRDNAGKPELFDAQNNRVEFTVIVPAENEPRKLMAAVLQEDLAKLGIAMQIAPIDFQGVSARWQDSYDYDAVLLGLSLTGIDPSSFASFLVSNGGVHQWHPKQPTPTTEWEARIDKLFAEQAHETDKEKRKLLFNEIQGIVADEMPIVPIVSRHIVSAGNSKIGNHTPSNILPYSLWNADELFIKK